MSQLFVCCELGAANGRVLLGSVSTDEISVSEIYEFPTLPIQEKQSVLWDITHIHKALIDGMSAISAYEEPVVGISCTSAIGDYLLFDSDRSLIAPTYHHSDPRADHGAERTLSALPWESLYQETGMQRRRDNALFALAAESSKRLRHATQLLPFADAFNFLLSGVPRVEMSLAGSTQLFNPTTKTWSDQIIKAAAVQTRLLPSLVPAGTDLGPVIDEIKRDSLFEDAHVVASCSHELAATLAGLPVRTGETWAFLRPGAWTLMGIQTSEPVINDAMRELDFSNQIGYGPSVCLYKNSIGLWILDECRRFWEQQDRVLDNDLLLHLAGSSQPFDSLIDPADPRFAEPGDMPLKIQAYCRETNQPVPRKPGPVYRCVLESLALHYRRMLLELERLTGVEVTRIYVHEAESHSLFNHFIANALELPVVVVSPESTAIGNVAVQAIALGHLKSLDHARDLVRHSFKAETLMPHAANWSLAAERLESIEAETAVDQSAPVAAE
jgi:rhamnulokinase